MFQKIMTGIVAASAIAFSVSAATYKIGVENINYLPHYSTDKGEYSGFGREIMDAFSKDAGHTFEYKPMPIKRLMNAYKSGTVDAKYPDNKYWGSDDKKGLSVVYSYPVVEFIDGVMVKPDRAGKGVENLKTLGTVLGFTPFEYLGLIKQEKVKVTENKSFTALLKQTMIGRIDGAYINVDVAQYTLDTAMKKKGELIFDDALPHTKSHYHISSINKPELIDQFNEWLTNNKGTVAKIKAKFDLR